MRLASGGLPAALLSILAGCGTPERVADERGFVGSDACRSCHTDVFDFWRESLHALAALPRDAHDLRAPFDGRLVAGASVAARPTMRWGGRTFRTDDGCIVPELVLGRSSVEQYLVRASGGRVQAFPLAFGVEDRTWFDIAPEGPSPRDWTHWTNPGATANSQCIECHVTGYRKGYDEHRNEYASSWVELGVGCEACHGPGRDHVAVHQPPPLSRARSDPYVASRESLRRMEPCAPCHSLRVPIAEGYVPGAPLEDFFDIELLDGEAFFADGQIRAEAYEWTAFRASRMAAAGVGCGDCHEPHRAKVRFAGNALCLHCHEPRLGTPDHPHHAPGSPGSECVACHMPEKVFVERDRRRDHAFTRPDPHRSRLIGAPDACTACHSDKSQEWAAAQVRVWFSGGDSARAAQRALAVLILAAREGSPDVAASLTALLGSQLDSVRRASVARLLAGYVTERAVVDGLIDAADDPEPLVRAGVITALGEVSDDSRVAPVLMRAAADPTRLVRVEAGFALRGVALDALLPETRRVVEAAFDEWLRAQSVMSELPEPHFNSGIFWAARGRLDHAERAYRKAVERWPHDLAPRQNLAMTLLAAGRPTDAEAELKAALDEAPGSPAALCSLGRVYSTEGRFADAAHWFEECVSQGTFPGRREALRELVRAAYLAGDRQTVERWLPQALLADPVTAGHPGVRAALGFDADEREDTSGR